MYKKILIVLFVVCFLLGMATRKELENVKKTVDAVDVSADVGELKIELVQKIDSVADYLISKDGEVMLYAPKKTGAIRASDVKMLNITEDPKTKVLSFKKTRSSVNIDPEILGLSSHWVKLFMDKIIYCGYDKITTKKMDGIIVSEIPCDFEVRVPVISTTGKYVAVIPSAHAPQYPSLEVYETETGKKLWEKFTPPDIYYGGEGAPPFLIEASFVGDDSLAVYYDGKIWLFDVKSGKIYWEREIYQPFEEYSWWGSFISVTENGDILFFGEDGPSRLYCLANTGKILWEKADVASTEISPKGKYVMILDRHLINLTDAKSGNSLWFKKTGGEGGVHEVLYGLNDEYIIIEGQSNEYLNFFLDEYRDYNIFILKSSSGEVVKKFKGTHQIPFSDKSIFFSDKRNILSFKNGDTVFLYQLTLEATSE